ncbi:MAG: hypothetical protein LBG06_12850 [Deltaproteobacteria bacterium]|jgi:hypothetical protein|nr:hypothetical protein [Deltaproteobacteria bacterium]
MLVENRFSYNPMGRLGPVYPRPEYRPPQNAPGDGPGDAAGEAGKGAGGKAEKAPSESLVLSPRLRRAAGGAAADAGARLNLQGARELAGETARGIAGLDPRSENGCPHRMPQGHGLLYPAYA